MQGVNSIFIKNLTAKATIGIYAWERQIKQTITLDLEMPYDINRAAQSDDLSHTIDYEKISQSLTAAIENSEYKLIESLASHLANLLQNSLGVQHFKMTLAKPNAIKNADTVGVVLER